MFINIRSAKHARRLAALMADWLWAGLSQDGRMRLLREHGLA